MPFQSKAQRRKFYALKERGQMSQNKIDEWESQTPNKLPEHKKKAFLIKSAYAEGQLHALRKMGLDASAFDQFVQQDDTSEMQEEGNASDEAELAANGPNSQQRLLNPPSPWTGASPVIQSEPVEF